MVIRSATREDLPALTEIYNHYVRTSFATFDLDEFSIEQRASWFEEHQGNDRHVLVVAELDGDIVGYATSSVFRTKAAYDGSVETTVYVAPTAHGHGIGRALYTELLAKLVAEPLLHRAYAGIALPNAASVRLHRDCGFTVVGTFTEAGLKFGTHHDVQWFERSLDT
ncbi:MAG: N-acetyltransferase family protein [Aeromicrobium sp.]